MSRQSRSSVVALACAASIVCVCAVGILSHSPGVARASSVNVATLSTGPYITIREGDPGLPTHTIYRPYALDDLTSKLPILLWDNGYCNENNDWYRYFLNRLAESGFLVIARGSAGGDGGQLNFLDSPSSGMITRDGNNADFEVSTQLMRDALDWAIEENERPQSKFFRRLDTARVATIGYSCGAVAAMRTAAADTRVRSVLVYNSQVDVVEGDELTPGQTTGRVTQPIAWVIGGPTDITYEATEAGWRLRPADLPSVKFEHALAGHFGFWETEGGQIEAANIAARWLEYTVVSGDPAARDYLLADPCGFCGTLWSSERTGWENYGASQ